jgi:NAD(P)-dependent dehydrogenase (short-subunit alcohol dehydrogenase family)
MYGNTRIEAVRQLLFLCDEMKAKGLNPDGLSLERVRIHLFDVPLIRHTHSIPVVYLRGLQVRQANAVKSIGTPKDIAGLVSYLASENSRFVTGECYHCHTCARYMCIEGGL